MIKKLIKLASNPQGVLVQVILDQASKIFKIPKLLSYMEEENELDIAVKEMRKEFDSMKFKVNAQRDLFKDHQKQIQDQQDQIVGVNITLRNFSERFKKLEKVTDKVKKLRAFKSIGK